MVAIVCDRKREKHSPLPNSSRLSRLSRKEGERWGFFNRLVAEDQLMATAREMAQTLANGPNFAHAMTKTMLNQEWDMGVEEAIEAEAQAQAICMQTEDFRRAYRAFAAKQTPKFEGN